MAPLTMVTNKHLLPVYNKPMICYPIQTLVSAGITDIIIVTGGEYVSDFIRLLEDYGPYQYPKKVIPLFVTNLIRGKKVPLVWRWIEYPRLDSCWR